MADDIDNYTPQHTNPPAKPPCDGLPYPSDSGEWICVTTTPSPLSEHPLTGAEFDPSIPILGAFALVIGAVLITSRKRKGVK